MSSPYRHDAAVIRERREAVARDLTETESELTRLMTERGLLRRELEQLEERLPRAPLTVLDRRKGLRILAVCSVPLVAASVAGFGASRGALHYAGQVTEPMRPERQHGARYLRADETRAPTQRVGEHPSFTVVLDAQLREGDPPHPVPDPRRWRFTPPEDDIFPPPPK
jgi:hypothetical protein